MTYLSKDFQVGYLSYYRLLVSAQHHVDRICVLDDRQSVVAYHEYDSNIPTKEVLGLLSLPFPEVDVVMPHHSLTLVPQEVYDPKDMETYANYIELKSNATVMVKEIDDFGLSALYQFDGMLYHRWKKVYPEATFVPGFSVLFELAGRYKYLEEAVAFIQFRNGDMVDFLVTRNGELLFFNSFSVATKEDLVYYLLLVRKQFGVTDPFRKIYAVGHTIDPSWCTSLHGFCEELVTNDMVSDIEFPEELSEQAKTDINYLCNTACVSSVAK